MNAPAAFVDRYKTVEDLLVVKTCPSCGIVYAVPQSFDRSRHEDPGSDWHCPNGHVLHYKESDAEKLRKELAREKQRSDQLKADADFQRQRKEETQRSLTATRGVVTRIKNRVKNGICPCCNEMFLNLHEHMANQHPDFVEETER